MDAFSPPGMTPWRKRTLCRVRVVTYFNDVETDNVLTGWDYDQPFLFCAGGGGLNSPTEEGPNNTKQVFTLEAAAGIGAPWRFIFQLRYTSLLDSSQTFTDHDLIITPDSSHVVTFEAAENEMVDFFRGMLCLPAD